MVTFVSLSTANGGEVCELMLLLPSYLQIKAKNYDKVEKVSIPHTLEANLCVFNACKMLSDYLRCISDINVEVILVITHSFQSSKLLSDCADCTVHSVILMVTDECAFFCDFYLAL